MSTINVKISFFNILSLLCQWRDKGFEPPNSGIQVECSSTVLPEHNTIELMQLKQGQTKLFYCQYRSKLMRFTHIYINVTFKNKTSDFGKIVSKNSNNKSYYKRLVNLNSDEELFTDMFTKIIIKERHHQEIF